MFPSLSLQDSFYKYLLLLQRSDIVNGVVEVEAAKDEAPEAEEPIEEGKEEGAISLCNIACQLFCRVKGSGLNFIFFIFFPDGGRVCILIVLAFTSVIYQNAPMYSTYY